MKNAINKIAAQAINTPAAVIFVNTFEILQS